MVSNSTPYAVRVTTTAGKALRSVPEHEWAPIRYRLAHIAALAAEHTAPDRKTLEAAGFSPPLLRVQVGQWLILYDVSPSDWMVTVKYFLRVPANGPVLSNRSRPHGDERAGA